MTPADYTRSRCRPAALSIGDFHVGLVPVVDDAGVLNSLQSQSVHTARGGYVLAAVEPVHGDACPALTGATCACGAQALLERFAFGTS